MKLAVSLLVIVVITCAIGCAQGPAPNSDQGGAVEPAQASHGANRTEESPLLPTPFTAEEIRDEWIEGLQLEIARRSPSDERLERWTVVSADEDGAVIEYATIDEFGTVSGEPTRERSTWLELHDHASFPADRASRERVVRPTPLGELDGWLYTVRDVESNIVTEFFFAAELPGAPVEMTVLQDGKVVQELEQRARHRPGG